jgi:methylase of polypeptide subunit release factors
MRPMVASGGSAHPFRERLEFPALVFLASALLLLLIYWVFWRIHPDKSWQDFWVMWGAQLGVLYAVVVAVMVAALPSRFEKRVEGQLKFLEDRIRSSISSFAEVVAKAELLLTQLGNRPNTEFMVVSASPILGLELDDTQRDHWRSLLANRIDAGCKTSIVCLNPYGDKNSVQSELGEFCQVLADNMVERASLSEEQRSKRVFEVYKNLLDRGRRGIEEFQDRFSKRPKFDLKFGGDPPFQVIISRDEQGVRRSILYLSSTGTLRRGLPPSGFYTEESRLGELLENVFNYIAESAIAAPADPRSQKQRNRDFQLQVESTQRLGDYDVVYERIAPGFRLLVQQRVFPPEIALANDVFGDAIEEAVQLIWANVSEAERCGIDVGTGTGVLALLLAKHCETVIGIDTDQVEIANFKENYRRFAEATKSTVKFRHVQGSLLENINPGEVGRYPLIVFNYPYYPSPSNIFNVGGEQAGRTSIRPFFEQAKSFLRQGGGVVMPVAEIAGTHNPLDIAPDLGYSPRGIGQAKEHPEYGKIRIYLFTLMPERKLLPPSGSS